MDIVIKGTFDQDGVERRVADMAGSAPFAIAFTPDGVIITLPDNASSDLQDVIRRVVLANRYPFRKTYTGTFRPDLLVQQLGAFGVSIENCQPTEVSVVYDIPEDGLPSGWEADLDQIIANHNPNYVSPEEAHRQSLKDAWAQYAGKPIALLTLEELTQFVILYMSLNTNAIAADGTIRPIA